jgi:hypothetical protein
LYDFFYAEGSFLVLGGVSDLDVVHSNLKLSFDFLGDEK